MKLSIDALMEAFHESLVAIAPIVERVGVTCRSGNGFKGWDEWDAITETLFHEIVYDPCYFSLAGHEMDSHDLKWAGYEFSYADYSKLTFVKVHQKTGKVTEGAILAFHGFSSIERPFDTVDCVVLSEEGIPVSGERVSSTVPLDDATFSLRMMLHGETRTLTDFEVED